MKFEKSSINVLLFENGHMLLAYNEEECEYHVLIEERWGKRVAIYTPEEMEEIYGWDHMEMEFEIS